MSKTSSSRWEQSRDPKHMHSMCMRVENPTQNTNRKEGKKDPDPRKGGNFKPSNESSSSKARKGK